MKTSTTITTPFDRLILQPPATPMTALQDPDTIRHFQALCDACRDKASRGCTPSELRLYADGYLHCLCRSQQLNPLAQQRLEDLIGRWILDPSSSIWPEGHKHGLQRLLG